MFFFILKFIDNMSRKQRYSDSFIRFGMVKYLCNDGSEQA